MEPKQAIWVGGSDPDATLERASKAVRCLRANRLLAADLAGSGLGASTRAAELAAKTVPAMGDVIAFPTRLSWSHAHVWARPQHNTEWGEGESSVFCNRRKDLPCTWGGERHRWRAASS